MSYWKKQAEPEYEETVTEEQPKFIANYEEDDELLPDSIRLVVEQGQASFQCYSVGLELICRALA